MEGTIRPIPTHTGVLREVPTLKGTLRVTPTLTGNLTIPAYIDVDIYDGPTEITPSREVQFLSTKQKTILDDIVINPIPSNYGLITWNGSTLTIS